MSVVDRPKLDEEVCWKVPNDRLEEVRTFFNENCRHSRWSEPLGFSDSFVITDDCADWTKIKLVYG